MPSILWHIEPTSKCMLECPLCDRTKFHNDFNKRLLHEINIEHLINFLKNTIIQRVCMCGNNGDPIYHSKFYDLCFELKKIGCKLEITTNGSGRKKEWWVDICKVLDKDDRIIFSIDGLADTNHLYRKNSDWLSLMSAIDVATKSSVHTVWKFIVFKHNQHQIDEAKKLSLSLGINEFRLEKSDRWWVKDLMPDEEFVNADYKRMKLALKGETNGKHIMSPKCMDKILKIPNQSLYIDAEGNFYPCCWLGTYSFRYKTLFNPMKKKYNIKDNTLEQILGNTEIQNFFESTKSYETADKCCKIYCGVKNG